MHQLIANDKVFIRFTGNNLHPTDYKRIDDWVVRIIEWLEKGVSELYFFVHEPEKHLCADIAIYMIKELRAKSNIIIKAPRIYTDSIGTLF